MRDDYAMRLHSVPSCHPKGNSRYLTTGVFGALFLLGDEAYYTGTEKVSSKTAFNNYENHTTEDVIIT